MATCSGFTKYPMLHDNDTALEHCNYTHTAIGYITTYIETFIKRLAKLHFINGITIKEQ